MDIKVLPMQIFIDGVCIGYQNAFKNLGFDKERFEREIRPLLASGESWTQFDLMKWRWKHERTKSILIWSVMVLLLILAFAIQLMRPH